jgi:hypothetical protein
MVERRRRVGPRLCICVLRRSSRAECDALPQHDRDTRVCLHNADKFLIYITLCVQAFSR